MAFLLKCCSKSSETIYQFQLTNSGLLEMEGRVEYAGPDIKNAGILFRWEFEEVGGTSLLMATQDQQNPLSSAQFSGFAIIARIEAFVQAGVFFKAAQWTNFKIEVDILLHAWLKAMLGPEICRELFYSFHLGSFGETEDDRHSPDLLTDGSILDMEQEVNKWLSNSLSLRTRVAGFDYRQQRYDVSENDDIQLQFVQGDKNTYHESHNRNAHN